MLPFKKKLVYAISFPWESGNQLWPLKSKPLSWPQCWVTVRARDNSQNESQVVFSMAPAWWKLTLKLSKNIIGEDEYFRPLFSFPYGTLNCVSGCLLNLRAAIDSELSTQQSRSYEATHTTGIYWIWLRVPSLPALAQQVFAIFGLILVCSFHNTGLYLETLFWISIQVCLLLHGHSSEFNARGLCFSSFSP